MSSTQQVPVKERVAEFLSLESGRKFLVTGKENADGEFVLDEEIEGWFGQFTVFEVDGAAARFLGLRDVNVVDASTECLK
jgi:hypothetical protein